MNVTFRSTWSKGSSIIDAHMGGHIGPMLKLSLIHICPCDLDRTRNFCRVFVFDLSVSDAAIQELL